MFVHMHVSFLNLCYVDSNTTLNNMVSCHLATQIDHPKAACPESYCAHTRLLKCCAFRCGIETEKCFNTFSCSKNSRAVL